MNKLNVVFCGTPDFAIPTLKVLKDHPQVNLIKVITMPDRPKGRGRVMTPPPVATFAKENSVPLLQTANINDELLSDFKEADLFIVLAFAQFLGKKILDLPKIGPFNIHTSLLPKYRGAAPIQHAILNGDKITGVSIQRMVKKMDAGDVVYSHEVEILETETSGDLFLKLQNEAALGTQNFLKLVLEDNLTFTPQDSAKISFAPSLKKEDGHLNFAQLSSKELSNRIRAFSPWPGTYCYLGKKRLKIFSIKTSDLSLKPGVVHTDHNFLVVGCKDGSVRLDEVQLEGRKACSDVELLNGLKNKGEPIELK
ncbi:MAG: methionyl-tRNA formyltransferase [Epsilonproteobacteria bacterium]|nr:MAG: methionyl-tRNA formyltransferase [Campylobacterota bacterium]RLA67571.1 MAG: methionyl-tRNA formyltransferase [Campylobacterota bacterium]